MIVSLSISLILSIGFIVLDIKIPISWAYLLIIVVSLSMHMIGPKWTCLSYVLPIIYIIDKVLVSTGIKGQTFKLAYEEMICLVGLLHAIEGILTFSFGGNESSAIMTYKGEKVAGGYQAYRRWLVPLLLFSVQGIYVPLVAAIVYANQSFVLSPKAKARYMGSWIFIYGVVVLMLGYFTKKGNLPLLLCMLTMPMLHELLFSIDYHIEQGNLLYAYPNQGLRVMDFKEYRKNASQYIERGDIILKVNETRVNSEEAYQKALVKGTMNLVVQKIGGEVVDMKYDYSELEQMQIIFLPPI